MRGRPRWLSITNLKQFSHVGMISRDVLLNSDHEYCPVRLRAEGASGVPYIHVCIYDIYTLIHIGVTPSGAETSANLQPPIESSRCSEPAVKLRCTGLPNKFDGLRSLSLA